MKLPFRLGLAAAAVAALVTPAASSAAALGTNGAATPVLAWHACDAALLEYDPAFQCATARVPVDYRKPTGAKIDLAVSKLPKTGTASKLGSVFINPGGPGAPGVDAPRFVTPTLRDRFDIIGWDPRGAGASAPIRCGATSEEAASLLNPTFPVNSVQETTALTLAQQGAQACGKRGGALLSKMSTANTARDLELLRKAVGDAKLSYIGLSAGSTIGETYANLFTSTARALVLDGVIDPVNYTTGRTSALQGAPLDYRLSSHLGTNETVTAFLQACAAAGPSTCAFATPGATAAQLRTKFNTVLARIRAKNGVKIDLGDGEETFKYQDVIGLIYGELNVGIFTSQDLAAMLDAFDLASAGSTAIPSNDIKALLEALLRNRNTGQADPTQPYDNFQDAFSSVICADTKAPASSAFRTYGQRSDTEVAGFGPFWMYTTAACAFWPVTDADKYTGPWNARTTNPVLLVGNKLGDPSTRYANAVATQSTLGNARLLSVNMYGHTAYALASSCVDEKVDAYLINPAAAPANGTTCDTDFGPFDPISDEVSAEGIDAGYGRGYRSAKVQ